MPEPVELKVIETYRNVPIIEVVYPRPTLLTAETHREQVRALLAHPSPRMAVIISYNNLTCSSQYGAREQAELYQSPEFQGLAERVVCILRYQARSLTTLVSTMSAHSLIQAGPSNFAPDLETAVRAARRAIEALRVDDTRVRQQQETELA